MVLWVTAEDKGSYCLNTVVSKNTTVTLTAPGITSINSGAMQAAICGITNATLTADYGGAPAYEWFFNGEANKETGSSIQVSKEGTYTVRYKDDNGCWSKVSTSIEVVRSSTINMSWNPEPTDVKKGDARTYAIIATPSATKYEWSYTTDQTGAVTSIVPLSDGSSAMVQYGSPAASKSNVTITVRSVGHPCGDVSLSKTITVTDGCSKLTAVNLDPKESIYIFKGKSRDFTAKASANNGDERYEWFINGNSVQGPSTSNTYTFTAGNEGDYTVSVRATNSCTASGDNITAAATVHVNPDPDNFAKDDDVDIVLTGKNCYDVAQSNFTTTCGTEDQRPGDFLDRDRKWMEGKTFYYILKDEGNKVFDLRFMLSDPSVLIQTQSTNAQSKTFTLTFKKEVLERAKGRDRSNPLTFIVYALYVRNHIQYRKELVVKVQDCRCDCSAMVSGVMRAFKCHNAGADESLDPFVPHRGLHGAKYQFGADSPTLSMADDQSNSGAISGWNENYIPHYSDWSSTSAVCPTGYRVPTADEWKNVLEWNGKTTLGSWDISPTNYSSGIILGTDLFLPAAGFRYNFDGYLEARGHNANYWASNFDMIEGYWHMCISPLNRVYHVAPVLEGEFAFAVRCIANN